MCITPGANETQDLIFDREKRSPFVSNASDANELAKFILQNNTRKNKERAASIVQNHSKAFSLKPPKEGVWGPETHPTFKDGKIPPLTNARHLPMTPALLEAVKKKLKKNLEQSVYEYASFPHMQSQLIAFFKDETQTAVRIVISYLSPNKYIEPDLYSPPLLEHVMRHLTEPLGVPFHQLRFRALDQTGAYDSMILAPEVRQFFAFPTPIGVLQPTRLPQGANFSGAHLQRANDAIFADLLNVHVYVYLDDILIVGRSDEEADDILEQVRARAEEFNMKFSPKKAQVVGDTVEWAGYHISPHGYHRANRRILNRFELPKMNTAADLSSNIGILNFASGNVADYSRIVKPLRAALERAVNISQGSRKKKALGKIPLDQVMDDEAWESFEKLRVALRSPAFLKPYDENLNTRLYTDASNAGYGYVLVQICPTADCFSAQFLGGASEVDQTSDEKRPQMNIVMMGGGQWGSAQQQYSTRDKEITAAMIAMNDCNDVLIRTSFDLMMDHQSVQYATKTGFTLDNLTIPAAQLLMRANAAFAPRTCTIRYVPGKRNNLPDWLSRAQISEITNPLETNIPTEQSEESIEYVAAFRKNPETLIDSGDQRTQEFLLSLSEPTDKELEVSPSNPVERAAVARVATAHQKTVHGSLDTMDHYLEATDWKSKETGDLARLMRGRCFACQASQRSDTRAQGTG